MKLLAILLTTLLLFTTTAHAEGRITKIPWAGTLISDIDPSAKHKVPFPGILIDSVAWAEIQAEKQKHKQELELKDLEILRSELKKDSIINDLKIELKWTVKTYEERIKVNDQYTKRLEDMIKENSNTDWVPWAFVGGVVVGAAIVIGIVFGIQESK